MRISGRIDGWQTARRVRQSCLPLAAVGHVLAELQRVEAVGIYGIRDAMRITRDSPGRGDRRKRAGKGVSRVALELIGESWPTRLGDEEPRRNAAHGSPRPRLGRCDSWLSAGDEAPGEAANPLGPSDDEMAASQARRWARTCCRICGAIAFSTTGARSRSFSRMSRM